MHGIRVVLRIDKKFQQQIRIDPLDPTKSSTASLVTQGLLGDRYVTISRGLTGDAIPENGVVPGTEEAAIKQMVERGADLMQNLGALTDDIRDVITQVQKGKGSLGKMLNDPELYDHLNSTSAKLDTMASNIQHGQGTLGKLVASDDLYKRVDSTLAKADDVIGAVRDQKGTIGKLVYDPSAYDSIKGFAENGNALLTDVRAGKGSLGKLATDDALFTNLRDASANVRDATAKMNSNQGTMGKFFTDPALYDNMTGLTGDLRLLDRRFPPEPEKIPAHQSRAFLIVCHGGTEPQRKGDVVQKMRSRLSRPRGFPLLCIPLCLCASVANLFFSSAGPRWNPGCATG